MSLADLFAPVPVVRPKATRVVLLSDREPEPRIYRGPKYQGPVVVSAPVEGAPAAPAAPAVRKTAPKVAAPAMTDEERRQRRRE